VIAAVKKEQFEDALKSKVEWIFDLAPEISLIKERVELSHKYAKKYFIHFDLSEGLGKDRCGLVFAKELGIDGIISTRVSLIKMAREIGLFTIQRFFIVDSHSVETTLEGIKQGKPDMIEIMPATVYKVIDSLQTKVSVPIIAGGLVESKEEAETAFRCGASAVSTSRSTLWNY
jgi:glycerol uptake operon antiterminator